MKDTLNHRFPFSIPVLAVGLALARLAGGQTPEEHASHHPAPGGTTPAPPSGMPMPAAGALPTAAGAGIAGTSPAAPGGMGAGMGDMMKQMGVPPRKELYPALMAMPPLTPEKRGEVEQLAHDRMKSGAALMSSGLDKMGGASSDDDYFKMQDASAQVRQGILQFESGLAAHRALSEGKSPQTVALDWFKRDMNLLPIADIETPHGLFGLSWFHYFTMAPLLGFGIFGEWTRDACQPALVDTGLRPCPSPAKRGRGSVDSAPDHTGRVVHSALVPKF